MTGSNGNAVDYFIDRHLREGRGGRLAFAEAWRSLTCAAMPAARLRPVSWGVRAGQSRVD